MNKEKQIEELTNELVFTSNYGTYNAVANYLVNKGYRKQNEGEWKFEFTLDDDDFYKCSVCGRQEVINGLCKERNPVEHFPYCHCGAKMYGERREQDNG